MESTGAYFAHAAPQIRISRMAESQNCLSDGHLGQNRACFPEMQHPTSQPPCKGSVGRCLPGVLFQPSPAAKGFHMQMKSSLAAINSGALLKNAMAVCGCGSHKGFQHVKVSIYNLGLGQNICPGNVWAKPPRTNNSKRKTLLVSIYPENSFFTFPIKFNCFLACAEIRSRELEFLDFTQQQTRWWIETHLCELQRARFDCVCVSPRVYATRLINLRRVWRVRCVYPLCVASLWSFIAKLICVRPETMGARARVFWTRHMPHISASQPFCCFATPPRHCSRCSRRFLFVLVY